MDRKLNIAIFASAYHPSLGGVEELCRQLALELIHQGHHVIVLTNRWPRDLPATETIDGIPVYRLPFRLPEGSAKAAINYHLSHYLITQRMLLILHENKIDMLHVQCVSSNAHYALIAQDRLKLPLVVTLQGELTMDANQIFQKSPQAQNILRRSLSNAQVITACSKKTLTDAEAFYGKPLGPKASVIYNGVNLSDFEAVAKPENDDLPRRHEVHQDHKERRTTTDSQEVAEENGGMIKHDNGFTKAETANKDVRLAGQPAGRKTNNESSKSLSDATHRGSLREAQPSVSLKPPQAAVSLSDSVSLSGAPRPYIFAMGRFVKEKGFDILLRAFAQGTCKTHDLVLGGAGAEEENLKSLAAELGISANTHFTGRLNRKRVAEFMAACEFFVLPSRHEPLGIVNLEAMASGKAVLASRVGGVPEIILDGTNGLLVEGSNIPELATAMQKLAGDTEQCSRLGTAGKLRAAQFAWPVIAKQYEAIYAAAAAASQ